MRVGSQITYNFRISIFLGESRGCSYQVSHSSSFFLLLVVVWRPAHLYGWSFPYFGRGLKKYYSFKNLIILIYFKVLVDKRSTHKEVYIKDLKFFAGPTSSGIVSTNFSRPKYV